MSDMILMRTDQDDGYVNLTAAFAFEVAQAGTGAWAAYATFEGARFSGRVQRTARRVSPTSMSSSPR